MINFEKTPKYIPLSLSTGYGVAHVFLILVFLIMTFPAHASFWYECKVIVAGNIEADSDNKYKFNPISAKVSGGHSPQDTECFPEKNFPIIAHIDGQKPQNKKVIELKYTFYSGRTESGVMSLGSWKFVQ